MFDHRLAALLGRSIGEMRRSMPQREYLDWRRYWNEEPWGPWRDNMHAALIAREVGRTRKVDTPIDKFILVSPLGRESEKVGTIINALRVMGAGPKGKVKKRGNSRPGNSSRKA